MIARNQKNAVNHKLSICFITFFVFFDKNYYVNGQAQPTPHQAQPLPPQAQPIPPQEQPIPQAQPTAPWYETLPAVAMDYKVIIDPGKEDCYFQFVNPGATFYASAQVQCVYFFISIRLFYHLMSIGLKRWRRNGRFCSETSEWSNCSSVSMES